MKYQFLNSKMGSLTIIFGPMFSGKTTRMIQELTRFTDVTYTKCMLINHTFDDRNIDIGISSHSSSFKGLSSSIEVVKASKLENLDVSKYDVIGIDEGQFFDDLEQVKEWIKLNKNIIISGLISDSFMKPFGKIYTLIPESDNVIQCHSICSECIKNCGKIVTPDLLSSMKAPFTFRLDSNSDNQVLVGASDKYIPVCRMHFNELNH